MICKIFIKLMIYEKLWKFIKLMINKIFMKSYENLWFVKYLW
jgi:hypothetical protein